GRWRVEGPKRPDPYPSSRPSFHAETWVTYSLPAEATPPALGRAAEERARRTTSSMKTDPASPYILRAINRALKACSAIDQYSFFRRDPWRGSPPTSRSANRRRKRDA